MILLIRIESNYYILNVDSYNVRVCNLVINGIFAILIGDDI